MKIYDVTQLQDGMPVTELSVKVANVFQRKSGTGDYGEWSFQDLKVTDNTGEITVKAKNVPDLSHLKDKLVVLSATKSDKHGWVGLVAFDNKYDGKVYRNVKLTGACEIRLQDDSSYQTEIKHTQYTNTFTEKELPDDRQLMICRQHAITSALKLIELRQRVPELSDVIDYADKISTWTYKGKYPEVAE